MHCFLAGGCCSSLFARRLPSQAARADDANQTDPNAQPPAATPARQRPASTNATKRSARPVDAIVVTGIRRSIQDSIEIKRRECERGRSGIGRGNRQAARRLDRRIDRSTSRRRRAARCRACGDHLHSRLFARLHDGSVERPPAGELGLQPRGRVRPISVRAAGLGGGLQNSRRQHCGHGPRRHGRPSDHSAARIWQARHRPQPARPI